MTDSGGSPSSPQPQPVLTHREAELIVAFKRGVEFRENTNAPVPDDESVLAKLELRLDDLRKRYS